MLWHGKRTVRILAALVTVILPLIVSTAASAQCDTQLPVVFNQTLAEIAEKTEQFRVGNKPAHQKIFDARAKSGRYDADADGKLIDELKRRMLEVHSGMREQNAAIVAFKKELAAARENSDCAAAKRATDTWLAEARTRIAEYDRYFEFLEGLVKEASQPNSR